MQSYSGQMNNFLESSGSDSFSDDGQLSDKYATMDVASMAAFAKDYALMQGNCHWSHVTVIIFQNQN